MDCKIKMRLRRVAFFYPSIIDKINIPIKVIKIAMYCLSGSFSFKNNAERITETMQYEPINGAATAPFPLIAYT